MTQDLWGCLTTFRSSDNTQMVSLWPKSNIFWAGYRDYVQVTEHCCCSSQRLGGQTEWRCFDRSYEYRSALITDRPYWRTLGGPLGLSRWFDGEIQKPATTEEMDSGQVSASWWVYVQWKTVRVPMMVIKNYLNYLKFKKLEHELRLHCNKEKKLFPQFYLIQPLAVLTDKSKKSSYLHQNQIFDSRKTNLNIGIPINQNIRYCHIIFLCILYLNVIQKFLHRVSVCWRPVQCAVLRVTCLFLSFCMSQSHPSVSWAGLSPHTSYQSDFDRHMLPLCLAGRSFEETQ